MIHKSQIDIYINTYPFQHTALEPSLAHYGFVQMEVEKEDGNSFDTNSQHQVVGVVMVEKLKITNGTFFMELF